MPAVTRSKKSTDNDVEMTDSQVLKQAKKEHQPQKQKKDEEIDIDVDDDEDDDLGDLSDVDIDIDDDDDDDAEDDDDEEDLDASPTTPISYDDDDDEYQFADENDEWLAEEPTDGIRGKKNDFKVLDAQELINNQQEQVIHVSEVLGIPVSVGGVVLRNYNWDKERLFQDFLEDQEKVLRKAGVSMDDFVFHRSEGPGEMTCSVCFDDKPNTDMMGLGCKHLLCKDCWKEYLEVEINDGPTCLQAKCPYPKCDRIVHEALVKELVSPHKFKLYHKYLARSFVDDNPRIRWCPAPDCGRAVYCPESVTDVVECACGNMFCFKCSREHHQPCSCDELTAWMKKEKDESETATWLSANTKDCPKCKRSIEKNGGCNHMTCSLCKHEFCWVCNDDWAKHGANTGGYYKCNRYKPEDLAEKNSEKARNDARAALEKYMFYYKRYANHDRSQRFEKQLREKADEKMKELQQINKYSSWVDVEYISKGVEQLIECRRSLKYTYVYGYYLKDGPEKNLFEYLQEDLERVTERLSEILEGPVEKFNREDIISTTRSAEKRLQHLLSGCQQGLTTASA